LDKRPYIAAVVHAVGLVVVIATLPLTLPALVVADLARRSKRFAGVRLLAYVFVILNYEMTALFRGGLGWLRYVGGGRSAADYADDNFQLQTWFGSKLFWWAARVFDWTVEVQNAEVLRHGPYLLLPRHVSMADTIMWPAVVSSPYGIDLHYVLKDELMNDPTLGILGPRGRHVFVKRGGADTTAQIARVAALADGLGPTEGVVIYPEGTRHTTLRRARIIEKLEAAGEGERAAEARSLKHLLPPRHGGPIALLMRARDIDVILAPHVGFEGAGSLGDLWNGQIIGRRVAVGFKRIPAAEIPRDQEGAAQWLLEQWRWMDLWVERQLYGS
jgi:1-acyl-sn-glycerol-3-phosphate acyltransferase